MNMVFYGVMDNVVLFDGVLSSFLGCSVYNQKIFFPRVRCSNGECYRSTFCLSCG